jgi:hypothetical protein
VIGVYNFAKGHTAEYSIFESFIIMGAMIIALLSLALGSRLILSDSVTRTDVIPSQDRKLLEQLIREGNENGVDQYVRLSSLTGATGAATRLGLTGLPLATIGLTIFFSCLAILVKDGGFLDLTKLTLGAFIGSFVQRSVSGERLASERLSPERTELETKKQLTSRQ